VEGVPESLPMEAVQKLIKLIKGHRIKEIIRIRVVKFCRNSSGRDS